MPHRSALLVYQDARSDKEYHLAIEPTGNGWVVNFAFGRRGSTLQPGTKTPDPVALEEAERIYQRLLNEKIGKGYRQAGTPAVTHQAAGAVALVPPDPMLCNPISQAEAQQYLSRNGWWMNPKHDGRRIMIHKLGPTIFGTNRKGANVPLPAELVAAAERLGGVWTLDGELVGQQFFAFDRLFVDGRDLRQAPLAIRIKNLALWLDTRNLTLPPNVQDLILPSPVARTTRQKRLMYETLTQQRAEGVVFKDSDAPYRGNRPNAGGAWLKVKFYATASVRVESINQKRSVNMALAGGEAVGSVTIPPNRPVPPAGAVIEVRYLYAYPGGSLYQPTFLSVRDDITGPDAIASLKYKAGETE